MYVYHTSYWVHPLLFRELCIVMCTNTYENRQSEADMVSGGYGQCLYLKFTKINLLLQWAVKGFLSCGGFRVSRVISAPIDAEKKTN